MSNQRETAVSTTHHKMHQRPLHLPTGKGLALFALLLYRYSGEEQITVWLDGQPMTISVDGTAPFAALLEKVGGETAVLELRDP